MGFLDYQNDLVTVVGSPVESARFGFSTDRITVGVFAEEGARSHAEYVGRVDTAIASSAAKVKIVRYPGASVSLMRDLQLGRARLYPGGSLLYWESPRVSPGTGVVDGAAFEVPPMARHDYADEMLSVIADSFAGYVNHYSANPLIPPDTAALAYGQWAESTVSSSDNKLFVVRTAEGSIVGVAVISAVPGLWEIELASIVRSAQRQGFYLKLIREVLRSAAEASVERVVISTQSHNVGVQSAWAKLGLHPILAIDTVHIVDEFR